MKKIHWKNKARLDKVWPGARAAGRPNARVAGWPGSRVAVWTGVKVGFVIRTRTILRTAKESQWD